MKTIITAILLLVSTLAFSQGIGESYYDVMKSLKEDSDYSELKFDNTSNKDYNLITATTNWANYIYFFPKTGDWQRRCSVIAMISKSRQDASDFIEYLNSY